MTNKNINKVTNISDKYIELSEDELRKMIPWFAGFIDLGRKGYRIDMDSTDLATKIIEWRISKNKKCENKNNIIRGGFNDK